MSDSSGDEEATVCPDDQSIGVGMDDLTLGNGGCTTEDGEGKELKDHTGEDLTEDDAPQGDVNQS